MSHSGNQFGLIGRVLGRGSRWRSVLFGLLYELRNFPRRMAARCKEDIRQGVCLGPLLEQSYDTELLIPCIATHARIADMQRAFQSFPFLTAVDQRVVLDVWEMGFRFGATQTEAKRCGTPSSIAEQFPSL
jgi:hypothetical protein